MRKPEFITFTGPANRNDYADIEAMIALAADNHLEGARPMGKAI